jgi:hypothetical protein
MTPSFVRDVQWLFRWVFISEAKTAHQLAVVQILLHRIEQRRFVGALGAYFAGALERTIAKRVSVNRPLRNYAVPQVTVFRALFAESYRVKNSHASIAVLAQKVFDILARTHCQSLFTRTYIFCGTPFRPLLNFFL